MIKAVLLDLDDTLLNDPGGKSVETFLHLADQFFEKRWGYPAFSALLIRVVAVLTRQHDTLETNTDNAEAIIAAAVQRPLDEIRNAFEQFYAEVYPALRPQTARVPLAAEIINKLRERDLALVIATNPIYPTTAILQRLQWAGLPHSPDDYALITTADNMHFAKPDPAYYAEIIARVGVEPDETLMVGDNLMNDILPAERLGMNTYSISSTATPDADTNDSLAGFYRAINSGWLDQLEPMPLNPESIEPQMRGNLGALFGFLALVKPHQWTQHPDPQEWSIIEILCHLLESERSTQRPRLERILAEDNPFLIPPGAPPGPYNTLLSCSDDGWWVADQFCNERQKTIVMLNALPVRAWNRPARHSIFGLTSLLEMAHFTAQHDRLHLNQLCETLGRCNN